MVIRPATESDIPALLPVFDAARGIMRAGGNLHQWADSYPGPDAVLSDIARGGGYVISNAAKESILAYFALLPSPEPTYARIDGAWLTDGPYGVIHRIASYPDVHGIFSAIIDFAAARYPHIRIDTHRDNRIMQYLVEKHGFSYCGVIWLANGAERFAYER